MTIVFAASPTDFLVSDMIEETKRTLIGMQAQELNLLQSAMGESDTTFTAAYAVAGIGRGSYLAIDDEIIYVWSSDNTGNTVVIQRGMMGTEAASHDAGSIVEVNPRYANFAVRSALKEEIRSWGPQVYTVMSTTIQTSPDVRGYDLQPLVNNNFYNIMSVRRSTPTVTNQPDPMSWPRIDNWQIIRSAPVTDFPSGCGLVIPTGFEYGAFWPNTDGITMIYQTDQLPILNVVYSAPFDVTTFLDKTSVLLEVGLDATMIDVPPLGAAWRLMVGKESQRLNTESMSQPADLQYHPPLYALKAAEQFKQLRDSRINDMQVWLMNRYGVDNWGL